MFRSRAPAAVIVAVPDRKFCIVFHRCSCDLRSFFSATHVRGLAARRYPRQYSLPRSRRDTTGGCRLTAPLAGFH
jgi:hypothetical protein